jgi:hypothetical protein
MYNYKSATNQQRGRELEFEGKNSTLFLNIYWLFDRLLVLRISKAAFLKRVEKKLLLAAQSRCNPNMPAQQQLAAPLGAALCAELTACTLDKRKTQTFKFLI